jgi:hypothetical protein
MNDEIGLKVRGSQEPQDNQPQAQTSAPTAVAEVPVVPLSGLRNEPASPPPSQAMSLVRYLDEPLWRVKGWMQLLGVMCMIHGAVCILTLWGILFCWIPIWMGLVLFSASKNARAAAELDNQDYLRVALEKVALYFKILGVLTIVGLVLGAIGFVAGALGLLGSAAMMNQAMSGMSMQ